MNAFDYNQPASCRRSGGSSQQYARYARGFSTHFENSASNQRPANQRQPRCCVRVWSPRTRMPWATRGHPDVPAEFRAFTRKPRVVPPDLRRRLCQCHALRRRATWQQTCTNSDSKTTSIEEKQNYYDALASATDPKLVQGIVSKLP